MRGRDYAAYPLDELMVLFVRQQDPLGRGSYALGDAIARASGDIARREISRHLDMTSPKERQTLEEAWGKSMLSLWTVLMKAQERGDGGFLKQGAEALVRSLAQRALIDIFREQRPEAYRLQCQVDYVLDRHPDKFGFVCRAGILLRGRKYALPAGEYADCSERNWDRGAFENRMLAALDPREIQLPELLRKILQWHGRPMAKPEILACLKELSPVVPVIMSLEDGVQEISAEDRRLREVETAIEVGRSLQWLWEELEQLPREQLQAILWRMDADGLNGLAAQVGYDRMAAVLEIDPLTLVKLATRTPLEFDEVARLLGLTSQQARSRRARGWDRIRRRYLAWCRDNCDQLSLLETWLEGIRGDDPLPVGAT